MRRTTRPILLRYGGAVLVTALAVLLRWLFDPWLGDYLPLPTLFGAVALAVWLGGYRSALLAMVLGYLACHYLFVEPRGRVLALNPHDLIGLLLYLSSCGIIIGFGEAMHAARRRLEARQRDLKQAVGQRRDAEEELRQRKDDTERLLQILPAAVWVAHDPECRTVTGNEYANRFYHQADGINVSAGVPPDERQWVRHTHHGREMAAEELPLQRTIATGRGVENIEFGLELPDGRTVHLLGNTTPLFDAAGRVRGAVAACVDITAIKEADEALRRTTEQLQIVTNSMSAPVTRCSRDLKYLWVSKPYGDWIDRPADEVVGRPVLDIIGPEAFERLRPHFQEVLSGQVVRYEEQVDFRGIGFRWVNAVYTPTRGADGAPDGWVAVVTDVTDRRRMEESLRQGEARIRHLAEAMPQIVWTAAADGRITYINGRWTALTGLSLEETNDLDAVTAVIHPDDVGPVFRRWGQALAAGTVHEAQWRFRDRADGAYRWFLTRAVPVRDAAGAVCEWFGTATDIDDQKRVEEALGKREREFRALADNTPALVARFDRDLRHLFVNRQVEAATGLPASAYIGKSNRELGAPEELYAAGDERLRAVFRTGQAATLEFVYPSAAGPRHFHSWFGPEVGPGGEVESALCITRDVTEQKELEIALRQRVEELQALLDTLPIPVKIAQDPACRRITGNRAAHELLRVPERGNLSKTAPDGERPLHFRYLRDGAEVPGDQLPNQRAARGEVVRNEDLDVAFEDGTVRNHTVWAVPLRHPDGRVRGAVACILDVTERKRVEEDLRQSEERFRQLAENINEVFWITDPQTTQLLYISPAYERVWGRSCQSLYDNVQSFLDAVHPDDRERVRADVLQRQSRGEQVDKEYRVVRPDGAVRWVRDRAFPVRNAEGHFYRLVGIIDDFTERKNAEDALREADRRKDEFLAVLAHELRNPLAPLRNGLQVLRLAGTDRAAAEQARAMMDRQLDHFVRLVDDLLDLSRISRGKIALRKERVDLAAVVSNAVESCDPLIKQSGHELIVTLPDEPVYVDADATRLAQVFCNLLTNAAKFSERGGRVCLTAERQGGDAVVSVKDAGVGIPPHMLGKVFEMFAQVDRSLEKSQGGLGIGLSLVQRLVEMHGGSVEARSEGPGTGSEFLVRLPIALALVHGREPAGGGDPRPAPPTGRYRVLVVDDNADIADSMAMMLTLLGNEVRTARDGLEGVEAAAAYRPDLILLDIAMPRLNGYDACRRIREQPWGRGILIAAITGWGQDEDRRRSLEAGFDHHLVKPVGPAELEKLLAELRARTA